MSARRPLFAPALPALVLVLAFSGMAPARAGMFDDEEARRQIKGGGLRVNDAPVTDEKMALSAANLTPEGVVKLSLGKKKHVLIKPV